nr:unnamed protein product [Spirometra erinaceieuropaei]
MADEYADLKQMLQQQLKLMEALTVKLSNSSMGQSSAAGGSQSVDHIAGSIPEFLYDPQAHITFDSWYKRYEDLFSVDLAAQDDAWKVRLLLRKLGAAEYERYANFILPKNPRDVAFKDTVETLSQIFGDQSSLSTLDFSACSCANAIPMILSRMRALSIVSVGVFNSVLLLKTSLNALYLSAASSPPRMLISGHVSCPKCSRATLSHSKSWQQSAKR